MKLAFTLAGTNPSMPQAFPFRYGLDLLERRYGQPPGSARTWDAEDLLRALEYQRFEAVTQEIRNG